MNVFQPCRHFSLVQFSHSLVSNSLRPHESQHARPLCPPPTPGVYSNSSSSSWWCHPVIQPSHPLSSPSPPALNPSQHQGLFQSQLFAWDIWYCPKHLSDIWPTPKSCWNLVLSKMSIIIFLCLIAQLCLTFCDSLDGSPPVHGIFQAWIL